MIPIVMGTGIMLVMMMMIVLWADHRRLDVVSSIAKKHEQFVTRNRVDWTVSKDDFVVTRNRRVSTNHVFEVLSSSLSSLP